MFARIRALPYPARTAVQAAFLFVFWLLFSHFVSDHSWIRSIISAILYAAIVVGISHLTTRRARRQAR